MAVDRSALIGQTYQNPQQYLPQAPIAPQQPYQDEVGPAEEGLAQVDGLTSDYYDKWAALKGFAREAHENLGIDVRFPDPSVPESNRLHRIYLKALADLKKQGNLLKVSQSEKMASLNRGDIQMGGFDSSKTPFAQAQYGNEVVNHVLDPIVTEANDKLGQQYFGSTIKEAQSYYKDVKSRLLQKAKENPGQANYWLRQVDALIQPTRAEKEFDPYRNPGDRAKMASAGAFARKQINLANGTDDSYHLSNDTFGPNGERVFISTDGAGETYGGKTVLRREFIPGQGKAVIIARDANGNITRTPTTDVMSTMKGIVTENPRYAAAGEYLDAYAQEHGLMTSTGSLNEEPLLTPDAPQRRAEMQRIQGEDEAVKTEVQVDKLRDQISDMKTWMLLPNDKADFIGKSGVPIRVRVDEIGDQKVYVVTNASEAFPKATKAQLDSYKKPMGKEDLVKFLAKQGAHLQTEVSPEEVQQRREQKTGTKSAAPKGKTITRDLIKSKVGTKGFEGYTEQELIDYYTSQGYTLK